MRPYTTREYNDYPYVIMTSDKVWNPSILTDHSFTENTPNLLHLLPHDDYDVEGEYIRTHGTEHRPSPLSFDLGFGSDDDPITTLHDNGIAEFDEFVADSIFEDAIQQEEDFDELFHDPDEENSAFWLNDAEFLHNECLARCVNAALRESGISYGISSSDKIDLCNLDMYEVNKMDTYISGQRNGVPHQWLASSPYAL